MAVLTRTPAAPRTTAQSGRSLTTWFRSGGLSAIVFALPLVLTFLYFSWGPIVRGLVLSLQKTNLVTPAEWVGMSNFSYVLTDPQLPQATINTLYFALLALIFGFPVPLFLAVFISELRKTGWLYNVISYLPAVVPPVVAILLWKYFYDPGSGVFNAILGWFGLGPYAWLNSPNLAMPAIVLEATWAGAGATSIIYLAALTGVRNELYEAAELDGAGIWRRVWHVTIPQIRGIILIMMLLQLIGTFQVFTEPFLFTGGGPDNATTTILLLIYRYAFINGDFGAATALSVLLALVLCVLSVVYHFLTRRWSTT
ncbi:sugar ABC transporter permease [Kribbella ginsengisoli]|uniref:Sugar ABC transporter permease n=1 Tax=Kribbella ginsengisoli TaxID=363865 RepID=A0ABP6VTS7_9ACTN